MHSSQIPRRTLPTIYSGRMIISQIPEYTSGRWQHQTINLTDEPEGANYSGEKLFIWKLDYKTAKNCIELL